MGFIILFGVGAFIFLFFTALASVVENTPKACVYVYAVTFVIFFITKLFSDKPFFERLFPGLFALPLLMVFVFLFFKLFAKLFEYAYGSDDRSKK